MHTQPNQPTAYMLRQIRQLPPHKRKKKAPIRLLMVSGFVAAGLLMMVCMVSLLLFFVASQPTIAEGVTVGGVAIGGQRPDDAEAALAQAFATRSVRVTVADTASDVLLRDLGITLDAEATIENVRQAQRDGVVAPVYNVDLVQAQSAFVFLSDTFNVAAVATPPQVGRAIEIPVMLSRLREDAAGEIADGELDLTMIEIEPPEPESVTAQNYTGPSTTHIVERGQELGLIAKQYNVSVDEIVALNDIANPDLVFIRQELTIPASGEYQPSQAEAPPPSTNSGRALVVSLSTQRIFAYDNGQLVNSHLVSTGLPETPTVLGDYNIYVKYRADDMTGPDYFLPQVPYTMYFYQGYAIHGTYWHNSFGRPMSHGCVNLPVDDAEWFFNFASVGTPVRVVN